jgi:hypothetical protein
VALIICKHGRYTTYRSKDHKAWPPSVAEIVSVALLNSTGANTDLGHDVSSPEDVARRYREASFNQRRKGNLDLDGFGWKNHKEEADSLQSDR